MPLGGGGGLQGLHISTGSGTQVAPSEEKFRGIKSQAVVNSEALTKFACHIAGVAILLGFEYVTEIIPILMALVLLQALGAIIDLPKMEIHFLKIKRFRVPLHRVGRGHIAVRLDGVNGEEGTSEIPESLKSLIDGGGAEKDEYLVQVDVEDLSLPDGRASAATKIMSKKQGVWFEDREDALHSLDQEDWGNLRNEDFSFGGQGAHHGGAGDGR